MRSPRQLFALDEGSHGRMIAHYAVGSCRESSAFPIIALRGSSVRIPKTIRVPPLTGNTLAWRGTDLGTLGASCTSARTRGLAAARIGTSGRMRGSSWRFQLPDKSGFPGVAGLDAFVRFLLHLLVGLDLLLARRRGLLRLCRRGDGHANRGRGGEN
jgi:hypothetical protein